jgi:non-heme chloroperoxidase
MAGRQNKMLSAVALTAAFIALAGTAHCAGSRDAPEAPLLKKVHVNGVELHYLEQGTGVPVVFVHGGLVDYRRWVEQVGPFAQRYRVITYSRRYNFPNQNESIDPAYSAAVDAEDLAALIKELRLGRVHVVGESYGALAALFLAVRHPELVRSLTLAEAPMMRWLNASPEGRAAFDEFQHNLWQPVGRAFRAGHSPEVVKIVVGYFLGGATVEAIPAELRALIEANLREWQALSTSADAFPSLRREEVAGIRAPTLLLGGESTLPLQKILDAQYAALLPDCRRVIIAHATHEMWDEQPASCREQTLKFLAGIPSEADKP